MLTSADRAKGAIPEHARAVVFAPELRKSSCRICRSVSQSSVCLSLPGSLRGEPFFSPAQSIPSSQQTVHEARVLAGEKRFSALDAGAFFCGEACQETLKEMQ